MFAKQRLYAKLLIIVLSLLNASAFANWVPGWHTHFLLGGSFGFINLSGSSISQLTYTTVPAGFPQAQIVRDYSDHKFFPSFIAGYQGLNGKWVLGAELNFDWQNLSRNLDKAYIDPANLLGWEERQRYERKLVYGLTGRLGYSCLSYFMPYIRFGAEMSDDELHAEFSDANGTVFFNQDPSVETWVYRFLFGIGAEFPLPTCMPVSLRAEYNYHSKGKTLSAAVAGQSLVAPLVNPIVESQLQPWAHSGRISLIWNFF